MRLIASILGFALVMLCASPGGADPLKLAPGEVPVPKDWAPPAYVGRVIGLTDKTVSLKLVRELRIEEISFNPDGSEKSKMVYIQDNNQPAKLFVFHEQLLPRANGVAGPQDSHTVADLRLGDVIKIRSSRDIRGDRHVEYCHSIRIQRRPGGQIPPLVIDKALPLEHRWHTKMNIEQAREEKAMNAVTRLCSNLSY